MQRIDLSHGCSPSAEGNAAVGTMVFCNWKYKPRPDEKGQHSAENSALELYSLHQDVFTVWTFLTDRVGVVPQEVVWGLSKK